MPPSEAATSPQRVRVTLVAIAALKLYLQIEDIKPQNGAKYPDAGTIEPV